MLKTKYVLKQNTSCSQRVWELNGNGTPRPWFTGIDIDCAGRRTTTHADRGAAPLRVTGRRHLCKSYRPRRRRTPRGVSGRGFSRVIFANVSPAPRRSYIAPRSVRSGSKIAPPPRARGTRRRREGEGKNRTENAATAAPRGRRPFQRRARATAVVSRDARNASAYEYSNQFRAGRSVVLRMRAVPAAGDYSVRALNAHRFPEQCASIRACARGSVHSQRFRNPKRTPEILTRTRARPGRAPNYIYTCT